MVSKHGVRTRVLIHYQKPSYVEADSPQEQRRLDRERRLQRRKQREIGVAQRDRGSVQIHTARKWIRPLSFRCSPVRIKLAFILRSVGIQESSPSYSAFDHRFSNCAWGNPDRKRESTERYGITYRVFYPTRILTSAPAYLTGIAPFQYHGV